MPKFFKKPNFPTKLFVASSLAVFFLFFALFIILNFYLANNSKNEKKLNEKDHYNYENFYDTSDPFITKVPSLKDLLTGPIISESDPSLGNTDAPIVIVEFSDFECEFCHTQEKNLKKLIEKYPDKIRLIWKDYPDDNSFASAVAGRCANEQNKFWEYHDLLFNSKNYLELAEKLNLDLTKFSKCLNNEDIEILIKKNINEANAL
ncbi:MAG: thioredoxin domain-containing protein, partial [Candidatus Falkowbacteria bacterium]